MARSHLERMPITCVNLLKDSEAVFCNHFIFFHRLKFALGVLTSVEQLVKVGGPPGFLEVPRPGFLRVWSWLGGFLSLAPPEGRGHAEHAEREDP